MLHLLLATLGPDWFWHPLGQCTATAVNHVIAAHEVTRCKSYNWYSGFAANFGELAIIASILGGVWQFHRKTECHVEVPKNCHRYGHPVPGTGNRACRLHHPHAAEKGTGVSASDIKQHHEQSTSKEMIT